ncbi:MAG: diguanylate cyclase [Thiobacillus sp.]|nr:diguanylate cyclase [Thiobacillus sp.]
MWIKLAERNPLRMKAEAYLAPPTHASLRMLRAPGAVAVNPQKSTKRPDKPRILAVNNESTPLLARMLAQTCLLQIVPSAARVLDSVRDPDQQPDLILLDARAPAGLAICRQIKADETIRTIQIVVITDGDDPAEEARALKLGADECITRPFHPDVVEARIQNQIRLKRRHDQLERHANQDSLTGVANRRCFDLTLDAEWRRAMRDGQPLAMVMIDVDCFKQFNDLYGHREGDHCLRRVVKALSQVLTRPGDLLARYGGEEFAAILPGTDLEGAFLIGEHLRQAVMELNIPQRRPDGADHVSISVGCASAHPSANLGCYSLLQAADDKLYLAKHSGRNCVR